MAGFMLFLYVVALQPQSSARSLLHDVCQFVSEQTLTLVGLRRILPGVEHHILTQRVSEGVHSLRRCLGARAGMNSTADRCSSC